MYYYGARYYDPRMSLWMSVDPLAEKMANISPYTYCFNNPIKLIDQDGKIPILAFIIKAGANAAADWFMQTAINYYFNPVTAGNLSASASDVNGWQIFRSGCEGLIPWRTPGGRMGRAALTAVGDVTVNYLHNPKDYTTEQAITDFSVGYIGNLAGGGLGELITKYGIKSVARGLSKLGFNLKAISNLVPNSVKWSGGKSGNALDNAMNHWWKHGKEFGYKSDYEYVQGAYDFLHNSPKGTLVKQRANGDILKYDPKTNTFGVMDSLGNPRTMFKPK